MKLEIDLVPRTCWAKSLCKLARPSAWEKLRKKVYADAGNCCQICGAGGRLSCDEIWRYDDEKNVQLLVGLRSLCTLCHFGKHIARARQVAAEGHLNIDAVIEHFLTINGIDRTAFEEHEKQAWAEWTKRSSH